MRTRALLLTALVLSLVALPTAALAHPAGSDLWDGAYTAADLSDVRIAVDEPDVPITRQSDNVTFLSHVDPGGPTSDMQFQRREGRQVLDGRVVVRDVDIAVMGGTRAPGLSIIDISDPSDPRVLSTVSCGGFHSDVAVYENYVVQSWDGSAVPCAPDEPADPDGLDRAPDEEGVRIFDITDPARPRLVKFYGQSDGIPAGVHNLTINGEAGLAYLNMAEFNAENPPWGFVDLDDPELPLTLLDIRDWSPTAADGCHDAAVAPTRQLLACAGITASYIWDITDPRLPTEVAVIPNPLISIHHGARWTPDEQLLVLGDETAGAAAGAPEAACTGGRAAQNPLGATWFYDAAVAELPVLLGTFSPTDTQGEYCTSHFYGFVAGTTLMPTGWYDAGIEVVDYAPVAGGLPGAPTSHAVFEPEDSGFFSAYAWHGVVYGSSFEYGAAGKDTNAPARGLWAIQVDGIDDVEPLPTDEGNVWGRWTPATSGPPPGLPVGQRVASDGAGGLVSPTAHTEVPTDALAVGVVALGAVALVGRRRED